MKRVKLILSVFTAVLILSSCGIITGAGNSSKESGQYTEENGAIPPDFGKNKSAILLVMKAGMKSYDKTLGSMTEKYYTGTFEYTLLGKLDQDKFADKEVYRFYFDHDPGTEVTYRSSDGSTHTTHRKQFFVYDRLNDVKYKCGSESSDWDMVVKAYMQNLDAKRLSM